MRFAFIATEKACYPVALMCRVLKVSRAGYYAWYKRPACQHTQEDQRLGLAVAAIYRESRGRYGSPQVHAELRERDQRTRRKRVARLMQTAPQFDFVQLSLIRLSVGCFLFLAAQRRRAVPVRRHLFSLPDLFAPAPLAGGPSMRRRLPLR